MIRKAALIVTVLALAASPLVVAQTEQEPAPQAPAEAQGPPPPPPRPVNIHLRGNPRELVVVPNVTGLCRRSLWQRQGQECPTELSFRWTGQQGNPGEKIKVEYRDGLYWDGNTPAQLPASDCLVFPGGQKSFELEHGVQNSRTVAFRYNSDACKSKVAFFFDVSCVDEEGGDCGGVEKLDPATMIDNGRR